MSCCECQHNCDMLLSIGRHNRDYHYTQEDCRNNSETISFRKLLRRHYRIRFPKDFGKVDSLIHCSQKLSRRTRSRTLLFGDRRTDNDRKQNNDSVVILCVMVDTQEANMGTRAIAISLATSNWGATPGRVLGGII